MPVFENPTNVWVVKDSNGEQIEYFKGTVEHLTKDALCLVMVEASSIWFSKLFGIYTEIFLGARSSLSKKTFLKTKNK